MWRIFTPHSLSAPLFSLHRKYNPILFVNLKLQASAVQPGLCRTWSETPKTGFLAKHSYFLGCIVGLLQGFGFAGLRALCSNMVEVHEQGNTVTLTHLCKMLKFLKL